VKLALNLGYWGTDSEAANLELAVEAERLGYDSVWVAEAYGSDVPSVLAWIGARTTTLGLGAGIMQIPARTPAMAAMTAATIDALSGGRLRLGFGVSGPQVSEGWHGVRFDKPLVRTREYIDIVRLALARQRVRYDGQFYELPLPDGPGKALMLTVHPVRDEIPIYLAAVGPRNLALAGEIADGWLAVFFSRRFGPEQLATIAEARTASGRSMTDFDVVACTPLVVGDDLEAMAEPVRGQAALYIGGMGSKRENFYNQLAGRMGYATEAAQIQQRYLARDYQGAAALVPQGFIDDTALIGPIDRIAERMAGLSESGVTTLAVMPMAGTREERLRSLSHAVEALDRSGAASG